MYDGCVPIEMDTVTLVCAYVSSQLWIYATLATARVFFQPTRSIEVISMARLVCEWWFAWI